MERVDYGRIDRRPKGTLSFASQETGGVAWWAHIGGFIAGMVLLPFFRNKERSHRKFYPDETYHYTSH